MAATATVIAINNAQYHYYQGVYYQPVNGGYQVVAAPVNAVVPSLPQGFVIINLAGVNYYYFGGIFYVLSDNRYTVVPAPSGAIVNDLPDGCEQVKYGTVTYLKYNNAYFQPIQYNGANAYEVVQIE